MTRHKAEGEAGEGLVTTVTLALGRKTETHRFEHLDVSTDDPDHVTVVLSSDDGRKIVVQLPRAEVKKRLSWRMIVSL
ncbi:MAG: hypothetical protein RML45_02020 [Acetobacteraceae bacterium]|nr:hypothetical protein [Acetobacteraceae bacterium]